MRFPKWKKSDNQKCFSKKFSGKKFPNAFSNAYPRGRLYFLAVVMAVFFALSQMGSPWAPLTQEESRALSSAAARTETPKPGNEPGA